MTLQGQIKPISLQGSINVVPNEGGTGGPLQEKTVYPSHEEQIITPDEDYYGLAVVKVEPVPRVPACFTDTGYQLPNVVQIAPVNIAAAVSVEVNSTYRLYNGVQLTVIPLDMLSGTYKYLMLLRLVESGTIYAYATTAQPYYDGTSKLELTAGRKRTEYNADEDTWGEVSESTAATYCDMSAKWEIVWSNHDIPNGSADATEIYFNGSEPVPIE